MSSSRWGISDPRGKTCDIAHPNCLHFWRPVGSDLVASLARPDGNATGLALNPISLAGKRLELLREVVPGFRRLSVMVNANSPGFKNRMDEVQAAASALGLEATILEIRRADDVASAFEALRDRADALYAVGVPLTFAIAPER
ncbi:ABC transporter substrate binding protein [Bradyrhizobium japonicum]